MTQDTIESAPSYLGQCCYCNVESAYPTEQDALGVNLPGPDDAAAWATLAPFHAPDCELIATRNFTRPKHTADPTETGMIEVEPEEAAAYRAAVIEQQEVFSINSEGRANWYLKRRRELESEIATIKAQAAAMIKSKETDLANFNYQFEAQAADWAMGVIQANGNRTKSVRLWQGTLAWRTIPRRLSVADAEAALRHAHETGLDTAIRYTLNPLSYRHIAERTLTETGEVMPGVTIIPEHEGFSVRFPSATDGADNQE